MHRTVRVLLAAGLIAGLLQPTAALAEPGAAAPTPTEARTGPPASVAVVGDSISAGTGADGGGQAGSAGQERPRNSWATGDWPGLDSVYQRVAALRPGEETLAFNLSENGRRSQDILGQVQGSPEDIGYILIQIGGNDLCRPTVADMTPTTEYRANVEAALDWIEEHRPDALVQINSVPDIYRLWEIRRTNFVAVLFWGLGIIPCQSLLASPTSTSAANMARRQAVRERGLEYNDELRDLCDAYIRCRYDDDATWLFSNDPATFVNSDISMQDHFHPSYQGQGKLAEVSWLAGFDFTDDVAPEVTLTTDVAATEDDWFASDVTVTVDASDDTGVAGLEVRTHGTDGSASAWDVVLDDTTSLTVEGEGVAYVEARAVDVNGNTSASVIQRIAIDTTDPVASISSPEPALVASLGEQVPLTFACEDALSGVVSCTADQDGDLLDTEVVGDRTVTVTAVDAAGNTATTTVAYRVEYVTGPANDRTAATDPIDIRATATLPLRVAVGDVGGSAVAGLTPGLVLELEDGTRIDAGTLTYDPVLQRYATNLSLRQLGVPSGPATVLLVLDDGTERPLLQLRVR
jgi:lysophospholipase L1-like esterase